MNINVFCKGKNLFAQYTDENNIQYTIQPNDNEEGRWALLEFSPTETNNRECTNVSFSASFEEAIRELLAVKEGIKIGTRVKYKKNPEFIGTVINIVLDKCPFVVKWDNCEKDKDQIDQFAGEQLESL